MVITDMAPNTDTALITTAGVSILITVTTEGTVAAITEAIMAAMAGGLTATADGPVEDGVAEATTAALVAADKPWKTKSKSEPCKKQLRHQC